MPRNQLSIRRLDNGTYKAVLATEYPVVRNFGSEVLEISPSAINLERFPLPVIVSHNTESLPVGVAENPRIENRQLIADVSLGESEEAKGVARDIDDGVITSVSIGYRNEDWEERGDGVYVSAWTPHEVSIVAVPADPHAKIGIRSMSNEISRKEAGEIVALGKRHNLVGEAADALEKGMSAQDFRGFVLDKIASTPLDTAPEIGLTRKEAGSFSLSRAILAQATGDWKDAGFEHEVIRSTSRHATRQGGFVLPKEMMTRDILKSGTGSNLVGTEHMGGSFIEYLYKRSDILSRVTSMTGMTQDIAIPRMTATASTAYYTEGATITESTPAFDQVTLSANTLAALVEFSRKMFVQGLPDVEQIVRNDLARVIGLKIDETILNGSGSGAEPTGILNTSGIGDVAMGTNGGIPNYTHLIDLIKEVAIDAADSNGAFIINPQTEAFLRKTPKVSSTDSVMILEGNELANRPVIVSQNIPSNLTKGTGTDLSAILYGNLRDVLYASFGGLEIVVDPHTKLNQGIIRVGAFLENDLALRHPESFAAILDANV
jgi:HK97 family phage major capsid protein/HK97 family phage prohead protease